MAGEGKRFEREFKKSAEKQGLLCVRFNDSDMSYNPNKELRSKFTTTNPSDFLIYKFPYVFFIENKSTKYKSISFELNEKDNGMIHLHQIRDLSNLTLYEGVHAGFVFNFRHEEENEPYTEDTYYMSIQDFNNFVSSTDRKSITPMLIVQYGGFLIDAKQRRKLYEYNVDDMLNQIVKREGGKDAN